MLYYKGGSHEEAIHYRGISLLIIVNTIFTKIMNERLSQQPYIYKDEQAGFRKHSSTIDQINNQYSMNGKYLSKLKGRFYIAFVDFTHVFDRISHMVYMVNS